MGGFMFLEIVYNPTSLFSLKRSEATNSAGKSLISPSPYSIKMALLNAIITYSSIDIGKKYFPLIRDLSISFHLPNEIVVNNFLIRILKDNDKVSPIIRIMLPFKSTIAFREYVYLNDKVKFAVKFNENIFDKEEIISNYAFLGKWFMHINYFGKKGCFFQFLNAKLIEDNDELQNYSNTLNSSMQQGIIYQMDDMNNKMKFDNVNNYDSKKVKREKRLYVFPYKQIESNKNYTFYRRIDSN